MGIATGFCLPIGAVVFLALGTQYLPLGVAVGFSIGVSVGAALEQRYSRALRPLTPQEVKMRKRLVLAGVGVLLAAVAIAVRSWLTLSR